MDRKLTPYTQESLLVELVRYFSVGIKVAPLARTLLEKAGLSTVFSPDVGFNSGQFHCAKYNVVKADNNKEACIRFGVLKPINERSNIIFGAKQLVLPMFNDSGKINNLYSFSPEQKRLKGFLYEEMPCIYPALSGRETVGTLIIVDNPYHCVLINSWIKEYKLSLYCCAIYGNEPQTKQWVERLHTAVFAKKVIVITQTDYLIPIIREQYLESEVLPSDMFDKEGFLNFTVQDNKPVQAPRVMPAVSEPQAVSDYSFTVISPTLFQFRCKALTIDVLGGIASDHEHKMKITVKVYHADSPLRAFRDNMDLYSMGILQKAVITASNYLSIHTDDLNAAMQFLTFELEKYRVELRDRNAGKGKGTQLSEKDTKGAMDFLKEAELLPRINELLGKLLVGEEVNRLITFLVMTSRKLADPLNIINVGSSGTGKTALFEKVSECMPEEETIEMTSVSPNSLFYHPDLKNKLLVIQDYGQIEAVLFQIRELISKKRLMKTVTVKDKVSGEFKTLSVTVQGPVCVAGSTTADEVYFDNANRSIIIYSDESQAQSDLIIEYQKRLSAGLVDTNEQHNVKRLLQAVQHCLKPVRVVNPFALHLTLPQYVSTPRRTMPIYMGLIEVITFLHQYQRELKRDFLGLPYILSTKEDVIWANKLIEHIILAKTDVLSGSCRSFFEELKAWLKSSEQEHFRQSDLIKAFRIHPSKVKRHIQELQSKCHLNIVGGDRYKSGYMYAITDFEEFENLKSEVSKSLAATLEGISSKEKYVSGPAVGQPNSRPLKTLTNNNLNPVAH